MHVSRPHHPIVDGSFTMKPKVSGSCPPTVPFFFYESSECGIWTHPPEAILDQTAGMHPGHTQGKRSAQQ